MSVTGGQRLNGGLGRLGVARGMPGAGRVSEVQRSRLVAAMAEVVGERGLGSVTVAHVVGRAGVSRRTFYDLFEDRMDCFLAAFKDAVARASVEVLEAYEREACWQAKIRAGLAAILGFIDEEPELGALCVVHALGGSAEVLEFRAGVLEACRAAVDEGRLASARGGNLAAVTSEGVVGGVFAVIHARMLDGNHEPFTGLLSVLMSMIVQPYLGPAAAAKELARPVTVTRRAPTRQPGDPLEGLDMRLTYRTLLVLGVITTHPGASNREIAEGAGVNDQGQVSKLLTRLAGLGLILNTGDGAAHGSSNAWTLTPRGQRITEALHASATPSTHTG
jgi:AcrR family transcriptional regulator